jgi:DNA-binding LacI/PurR family transcriptional regulator
MESLWRKEMHMENGNDQKQGGRVTLRTVADQLGLTPGTVSAVLNNTRAAERIPQHTRDRVTTAARALNYQPNPLARALRTGKSLAAQAGETGIPRGALVIVGADRFERALDAMQQAGLRASQDFSVLDIAYVPGSSDHSSFGRVS